MKLLFSVNFSNSGVNMASALRHVLLKSLLRIAKNTRKVIISEIYTIDRIILEYVFFFVTCGESSRTAVVKSVEHISTIVLVNV